MVKMNRVVINVFKREIGKNKVKVVSNLDLGDSQSTPYRVKIQREKTNNLEKEVKLDVQKEILLKILDLAFASRFIIFHLFTRVNTKLSNQ